MASIHAMLLVKKACEHFTDEFQQEISEVMYRKVNTENADAIASKFCPRILNVEPVPKKKSGAKEQTKNKKKNKKSTKKKAKTELPHQDQFQVCVPAPTRPNSCT